MWCVECSHEKDLIEGDHGSWRWCDLFRGVCHVLPSECFEGVNVWGMCQIIERMGLT